MRAFIFPCLLRYGAVSLKQKLFQPTRCSLIFTRFRQTGTGFSGPPATEPFVGDYRPISSDWNLPPREQEIPKETDAVIIGGGLVGLCGAFFIKHKYPRSFNIVIIEKDPLVRLFVVYGLCLMVSMVLCFYVILCNAAFFCLYLALF